jgi:hypothetical protein
MPFFYLGELFLGLVPRLLRGHASYDLGSTMDPLEFGLLWAVVLGMIGFRLCRLAAEEA